jgi:hypothetical protein
MLYAAAVRVVSGEKMKSLFLRSGVTLACALTLAACGGSGGTLALSGAVVGLGLNGLVLQNNAGDDLTVPAFSSTFVFPTYIGNDTGYNVTVKTNPPFTVCTPSGNTGRTANFDITTVLISCVTNAYEVGGTVQGLKADGLVLINGPDRKAIPAGATSFTMTTTTTDATGKVTSTTGKVTYSAPYGITVLTQPTGQTCTVSNGTATMGGADVNNVVVTCI